MRDQQEEVWKILHKTELEEGDSQDDSQVKADKERAFEHDVLCSLRAAMDYTEDDMEETGISFRYQ